MVGGGWIGCFEPNILQLLVMIEMMIGINPRVWYY